MRISGSLTEFLWDSFATGQFTSCGIYLSLSLFPPFLCLLAFCVCSGVVFLFFPPKKVRKRFRIRGNYISRKSFHVQKICVIQCHILVFLSGKQCDKVFSCDCFPRNPSKCGNDPIFQVFRKKDLKSTFNNW